MKFSKLVLALSLTSIYSHAFADEVLKTKIVNGNSPTNFIEVYCADASCDSLKMVYTQDGKLRSVWNTSMNELQAKAEVSTRYNYRSYTPYQFTSRTLANANKSRTHGFYGNAILLYTVAGLASAFDTILLPLGAVAPAINGIKSKQSTMKTSAKHMLKIVNGDVVEVNLREKQYHQAVDGIINWNYTP